MTNYVTIKLMKFSDIFRDENTINEKNIVGFSSFAIMTLFAIADVTTGIFGINFVVNDFIYNSFLFTTLGSFGISEVGKVASNSKKNETTIPTDPKTDSENFA